MFAYTNKMHLVFSLIFIQLGTQIIILGKNVILFYINDMMTKKGE